MPASPPARARSRIYAMRSLACSSSPWHRPPIAPTVRDLPVRGTACHFHELLMKPPIARQLGMKAEREDVALAHCDSATLMRGYDLGGASRLHQRRPDEHARKGLAAQARDLEVGLEAVDLAAIAVTSHRDVEQAHAMLALHPVGDVARENDHACARRECRQTARDG